MLNKEQVIELLREQSAYLASEFGIRKIGLFGSFAKGQPSDKSDIDIVVEFERPIGLRFIDLVEYLEKLFGRKVDILTPAGVQGIRRKPLLRASQKALSMFSRADIDFVNDIREAIQRISDYLGDMSYDAFRRDIKTQDAVIRNIEIVGEAAKGLSEELRAKTPHIPWKNMAGMRDRLIHHYFGVNLDIVWQVISSELPELAPELEALTQEDDTAEDNTKDNG